MEFVGILWITNLSIILLCKSKGADFCATGEMQVSPASIIRLGSSINISCILKGSFYNECAAQQLYIIESNTRQLFTVQVSANTITAHIPKFETPKSSFACKLLCHTEYLICGIDIKAGNPPDQPRNLECIQKGRVGDVICTWDAGQATHIRTKTVLWFRNESHSFAASATTAERSTAKCTKPRKMPEHQRLGFACESGHSFDPFSTYSVWVTASNQLGYQSSAVMNFTLDEIVKPNAPTFSGIEFNGSTSFISTIYWKDGQNAELFEIWYQTTNSSKWEKRFILNSTNCMVSALEHFVEYVFLIRARFHHTRGLWSDWSSSFVTRTPEAAPIGQLDVWYTMDPSDLQNSRVTLLWKPLKTFESRGIILGYNVTLQESSKNNTAVWTQKTKNTWYTVGFPRIDCVITVSAYNSKGSSPPTELHLSFLRDLPSARSISMIYTENNSLLIEWMEPIKPPEAVQEYVVEWMEVNGKLNQNINWFKVPPQNCSSRLTENIKPKTCFQIFVYAVYKSGVGRPVSTQKYTAQEVAPLSGPSVFTKRNTAELFWNNIPQDQKGGCLTSYRIYIQKEESKWPPAIYKDIDPSSRTYTITNLKPGAMYIVWMTAVTKAGEGKNGKPHRFYLSHKNTLLHSDSKSKIMIVVAVTFTIAVTVSGFCLWQSIRNSMFSILSKLTSQLYVKNIPDPANCTWAKEYTAIKGNLDFTYPYFQVDSTSAYEDPHSLQIEEILSDHELCSSLEADQDQNSQLSIFQIQHTASQLQQSEALSQGLSSGNNKEDMLDYKCQLPCLYVEKLSSGEIDHQLKDSQNSAVDQSIGYIPSNFIHITDNTTEANNQGFIDSFSIIPLPSLSRLAITYEGKLTLDVVRIDCSSLIE